MNIHLSRAELLMQQHRYELAEEQLRLALSEGTQTAMAHALLAICLLERDKFDEATTEAQQAIHEAPDEALGFYSLARVQWKRNRLIEAQATIAEAIRLEPWNAASFHLLSAIHGQRYQWQESLTAAEQGLQCDPDHIGCNNLRAIALVSLGRKSEAGQSIEATLSKNPEDAVTHANQGWTLLHQRQPREAAVHFREALRLEPQLEWARQGIIEAIKARVFLYRWLLSFFLWLSRFSPRVQLGLMIGLIFGQSLLSSLIQMVPILAPFALPIRVAYVLFVWMTWTSSSLFNLVLRLDSFGRLVLNPKERMESNLVGLCLIVGILVGSTAFYFQSELSIIPIKTGMLYLGLMLPLIATFRQPPGRNKMFAVYTTGVALCVILTTFYGMNYCLQVNRLANEQDLSAEKVNELKAIIELAYQWSEYSFWGIAISTWLSAASSLNPERQ